MPTFDVVSEVDRQEVRNAVDQARREINTRFDFKNTNSEIEQNELAFTLRSVSEDRLAALRQVFEEKLVKRGVSLKALDSGDPRLSGKEYRLGVGLKEGISADDARKISKLIRDEGPKGVRAQVQGEELRVSSKKKDDLQSVISLVKGEDFGLALQFVNYR